LITKGSLIHFSVHIGVVTPRYKWWSDLRVTCEEISQHFRRHFSITEDKFYDIYIYITRQQHMAVVG